MLRKETIQLMTAVALLAFTITAQAHNKVVVVPLGGDEAPTSKVVFVAEGLYNGDLRRRTVIGGIPFGTGPEGADHKCQAEADAPGSLVRGKTFKAWISPDVSSNGYNGSRGFLRHDVPYIKVNGAQVAHSYAHLISGGFLNSPINRDAFGLMQPSYHVVWTGLAANGDSAVANCGDWTSIENNVLGLVGGSGYLDNRWTGLEQRACINIAHIYCIEQ